MASLIPTKKTRQWMILTTLNIVWIKSTPKNSKLNISHQLPNNFGKGFPALNRQINQK